VVSERGKGRGEEKGRDGKVERERATER